MPIPPSVNEDLNLSADAYALDTDINAGTPPATLDGMTVVKISTPDELARGFAAVAVEDSDGDIIIVNEGTKPEFTSLPTPTLTAYGAGSLAADVQIAKGDVNTTALADARAFATQLEDQLGGNTPIFVTGHSLGGIEAEAEAAVLVGRKEFGGGATFGATGLPGQTSATTGVANDLIDYVDRGDPVGNYAKDTETLTPNHVTVNAPAYHYGTVQEVGSASNAAALQNARTNYVNAQVVDTLVGSSMPGSAVGDEFSALGFGDLSAALRYHLIANYATDVGTVISAPENVDGLPSMPLDWVTQQFSTPDGNPAVSNISNDVVESTGTLVTPYFTTSFNPTTDQVTITQTGNITTSQGTIAAGGVATLSIDSSTGLLASAAYVSSSGATYNATFNETTSNLTALTVNESGSGSGSYQTSYTYNTDGSVSSVTSGYSGANLGGTLEFTQTDNVSATDQLSVTISGTEAQSLNNAAITLAPGANATITGVNDSATIGVGATAYNPDGFSSVTLDIGSGSITLGKNTYVSAADYTDTGNITISLIAGDPVDVGTLSVDTSTGAASITLTDGTDISLPTISGNITISAAPSTDTPLQALNAYLTDLGYSGDLETANFDYLNPTGSYYTVTPTVTPNGDGTSADVVYAPTGGPGLSIAGAGTVTDPGDPDNTLTADNILELDSDDPVDITQDSITGVPTLTSDTDVTLTGAQYLAFTSISAEGLTLTDSGSYSLASAKFSDGMGGSTVESLTAQSWDGTTLTGSNDEDQTLTASLFGNDTLQAGNGNNDALVAGEGEDALSSGTGSNDIFVASDGLADGSTVTANGSNATLYANGDISGATVTGVPTLQGADLTLNAGEFSQFTTIDLDDGPDTIGMAGGSYTLTGKTVADITDSNPISFDAVSDDATTITGGDTSGGTAVTLIADGDGNDTLIAGGASEDSLTANGDGNDTLSAGGGGSDVLRATGDGNDILEAGNGNDDSLSALGDGNSTLTAGNGNSDALNATGLGTNTLTAGNGAGDVLTASNGTDTLQTGGGAGDTLSVTTGGNTLIAGSGAGDYLNADGGDNSLTGGSGGDVFNVYDEDNQVTGGSGNDTINLWGASGGGTEAIDLGGTTINGGGGSNTLDLDLYTNDISDADVSNIHTINTLGGITLTASQMAGISTLGFSGGGSYLLDAASAGTYNLAAVNTASLVSMVALNATGGTTLIGNNVAYSTLTSGTGSGDVLEAGSGAYDTLNLTGTNTTATGGAGGDYFNLLEGTGSVTGGNATNLYTFFDGGTGLNQDTVNNYHTGTTYSELYLDNSGITTSNVVLTQQGENLDVTVAGTDAQVIVQNYFLSSAYQLSLEFYGGTVWNPAAIASHLSTATTTLTDGSTTTFTTSGDTINGGSSDTVTLTGDSAETASFSGSHNSIDGQTSSSFDVLSDSASGTNNDLYAFGTGNLISVHGSSDSIALGDDGVTSDTGGGSDNQFYLDGTYDSLTMNGTDDAVAVNGSDATVVLAGTYESADDADTTAGGNTFTLSGAHDTLNAYGSGDITAVTGIDDTVNLRISGVDTSDTSGGTGNVIYLYSTGGLATTNGSSDTIALINSSNAASDASTSASNSFYLDSTGDSVTANGTSDGVTVNGSSDTVTLAGSTETATDAASSSGGNGFGLSGAHDTLNAYGSGDTVAITGSSDTVNLRHNGLSVSDASGDTGNAIYLYNTGDTATANGSSDTIGLIGNSSTASDASASSGNHFYVISTGDTLTANGSSDYLSISGGSDTVSLNGAGDTASVSASTGTATIGGTSDVLTLTGTSSESVTFGSDATGKLVLSAAASFSGTVAGLADADSIDLGNFLFSGTPTISSVTGTGASGTATDVTVTDGSAHLTLALLNQYANQFAVSSSAYTLTADGTGGSAGTLFQLAAGH